MSEKFTPGTWSICWTTYNGRKTNFDITASPYGSIRPIAGTMWKLDWSEVEGDELQANAHLIAAAPNLYAACVDIESKIVDYEAGKINWRPDDFLMRVREAVALARGEEPAA